MPVGQPGELWFKTPQLMKGYLGKPEETAKVITEDGWFRTGDIGKVDEGGYVYVEDRLKDMIISGGENIYSPEVERVMSEHPAVAEVAVIGVPDERWGEVVKAVVGLKPDTEATEEELIAFTAERLAKFKCPRSVDIVAGPAPQPDGQDPQEGPAPALLVRPRPLRRLTSWGPCVEALLDRVAGQLDPVVHLQLPQGVLHVVLHGAVRDDEPLGDLLVGQPLGDHLEDLGLPLRQLRLPHRAAARRRSDGTPRAPAPRARR